EVFAAGAHEATNPYWPAAWPQSQLPTQAEVDTAIAYVQQNNLWVAPVSHAEFDNNSSTPTTPYEDPWTPHYDNIPFDAEWIWHDSGKAPADLPGGYNIPAPFEGFDHDEFLIFRISGAVIPQ